MAFPDNVDDFKEYSYTGAVQNETLPPGKYKIELWGAQGGPTSGTNGGKGGKAEGEIELTEETLLRIYVGEQPTGAQTGGWNGGGNASSTTNAYPGGGSSDVRIGGTDLTNRILVAGGGGGRNVATSAQAGGVGGGETGGDGTSYSANQFGTGGTQTAGGLNSGAWGQGGNTSTNSRGGGGGGWYGGGAGRGTYSGGGGGSSYIGRELDTDDMDGVAGDNFPRFLITNGATSSGVRDGDGLAKITVLDVGSAYEVDSIIAEIEIEGLLGLVEIIFIGVEVESIVAEIEIEGLFGLVEVIPYTDWAEYEIAVRAPSRKWSAKVEIDFPEGTAKFDDDDIASISLLEEAHTTGQNPLGFITSNELTISLHNQDRRFTPANPAHDYDVRPGLEVRAYLVLKLPDTIYPESDAEIPLGTFWTDEWDTPSDSMEATVTCHDRLLQIINLDTPQIPVMVDTTIGQMFGRLFRALGLEPDEDYVVSPALTQKVKAGWWERDVVGNSLQVLAEAGNCFVTVNRDNQIVVLPNVKVNPEEDDEYTEDELFTINNPQRILDIYTAVKMQYRIPYLKEPGQLVRADNIFIPAGRVILDRIDFKPDDIPVMQIDWVHLYGRDQQTEIWDLSLGGATGGNFKLGDSDLGLETEALADIVDAGTIEIELRDVYGEDHGIKVTGEAGIFEFTFTFDQGRTFFYADFTNLTGATQPILLRRRVHIGPVQSRVEVISYGATDIILQISNEGEVDEEISIEIKGIGSGHHLGHGVVINGPAIIEYGHRELSCENHLIQSQALAKAYSEMLVEYLSDPLAKVEYDYRGDPLVTVGSIITVGSVIDKIPAGMITVHRAELRYDGGLDSSIVGRRVIDA